VFHNLQDAERCGAVDDETSNGKTRRGYHPITSLSELTDATVFTRYPGWNALFAALDLETGFEACRFAIGLR
jgi:hypothetical protein